MSGSDEFRGFRSGPKRPPPEHGIRIKRPGATWWGQRWIDALERMSAGYGSRLGRGRSYARAGRTHDLVVRGTEVEALVTGSRREPYRVAFSVAPLPDAAWQRAIEIMAGKAQFAAQLLAGEMPEEIDAAFRAAGASLFPAREADLKTACSCPDWANPCKHVAATHYVLGEAFDRDPFLLFELRGRSKPAVLAALRAARGEDAEPAAVSGGDDAADPSVQVLDLSALADDQYDRPRAPLPSLQLSFAPPTAAGTLLQQLGEPAAWRAKLTPAQLFAPLVEAVSEEARRIALADPELEAQSGAAASPGQTEARKGRGKKSPNGAA